MLMPQISCYYEPSGKNAIRVEVGPIIVWFSYRTPVAFLIPGHMMRVRQNEWGPTTGKHLNTIDDGDKVNRVTGEQFQRLWNEQNARLQIAKTETAVLPDRKW